MLWIQNLYMGESTRRLRFTQFTLACCLLFWKIFQPLDLAFFDESGNKGFFLVGLVHSRDSDKVIDALIQRLRLVVIMDFRSLEKVKTVDVNRNGRIRPIPYKPIYRKATTGGMPPF